jgi:hypothetical protein
MRAAPWFSPPDSAAKQIKWVQGCTHHYVSVRNCRARIVYGWREIEEYIDPKLIPSVDKKDKIRIKLHRLIYRNPHLRTVVKTRSIWS